MITALAVVIPARDEQDRIGRCLESVRAALAAVPDSVETVLQVELDGCEDSTVAVVDRALRGWPGTYWRESPGPAPVGAVRRRGCAAALARLGRHAANGVWLLGTDADSIVPGDWAAGHLRHAERGADAVTGLAEVVGLDRLHRDAQDRYRAIVAGGVTGSRHHHVYGANLGVRADAYLAVGGFAPVPSGEDHDLVDRLRRAGYRVEAPLDVRVATSGRLEGRAPGGLAALLNGLQGLAADG